MQRQLIVFSSMAGSASELARGLWRGGGSRRWIAPLAVFLCLTGAILVLAAGVEALAPFIYAIF
jgi:hypothetical protein